MGTLDRLGYTSTPANGAQRAMQNAASTGRAAWIFQRTLYPVDRVLFRLTSGRLTVPGIVAGLPVILLTTTGRKSGEPRTMPLLGVPLDDDIAIIGTNYGQQNTPGWVYNLEADPTATVEWRDSSIDVVARPADEAEADRAFELATDVYAGYAAYRERARARTIRVFVLESTS
ncbi:MAG: nitroreductase family deazaflavin-dependent oxidoreductase [Acidimicrobiales bacterium]